MKKWNTLCALGMAIATVLGATSSFASSVFFTPAGAQLDGDAPPDIEAPPPAMITFEIFVNVSAPAGGVARELTDLTYVVGWDVSELDLIIGAGELRMSH